ncbi:MAG TPA: GIY-YIG nuclease family protein [Candidatus Obscuribacterales bacterium]
MYTVYILRCGDDSLYTGLTTDIARRLAEHAGAGPKAARYTRRRQPVELVWQSAPLPDRSSATSLEKRIQNMTRRQKLLWIAQNPELAPEQPKETES